MGVVFALVWLASAGGLAPAVDRVVQRSYYALRGDRSTTTQLVFVAIDEHTAARWGPPPWPWTRYVELIKPLSRSGARLIAVLEPGPRVVTPGPLPSELAEGVAAGWLIVPAVGTSHRQPAVVLDPAGVVDAIELGSGTVADPSITRTIVEQLVGSIDEPTLEVNFIGTADRLPTVPAHHVAEGELPPSTFRDRVIVIGLRGERFTPSVPTPVGPMSPSEVHAHAIDGLLNDAAWVAVPGWVDALVVGSICVLGVVVWRRMRSTWLMVGCVIGTAVGCYVGGYLAFRYGDIKAAIGGPWIALVIATIVGLVLERRDAFRGISELQGQIKRRLQISAAGRPSATESQILDYFADALRTYLPVTSCVWAELPVGAWHVVFARWYQGSDADVFERRRDVRRDPWRLPYGSHKPEWSNRAFLEDRLGQRSLLVPVAGFGRLLGFWCVNIPALRAVSAGQLRVLEALADDIAITLSQQRLEWRPAETRAIATTTGALDDAVDAARHDAVILAQVQERTRAALELLPVGVLVATSWDMIEHCNAAMTKFLTAAGIERGRAGVAALIAELAGTSVAAARDALRDIMIVGGTMRLVVSVPLADGTHQDYDLALTRIDAGEQVHGERTPSSLVLTAITKEVGAKPAARDDDSSMGRVIAFRVPGTGDG